MTSPEQKTILEGIVTLQKVTGKYFLVNARGR